MLSEKENWPIEGDGKSFDVLTDIAGSFTYASFQNAVPIIRSIRIRNTTASDFSHLKLELVADPPFLRAKTWLIDRVASGEDFILNDRKVNLDAAYLAGLNEAERGTIRMIISNADDVLWEGRKDVRLLAREEWGGADDMIQLLPAFVMPNDPGIPRILKSAAEHLEKGGHSSGIDGYQSGSPQRAFMLTAAIYSAIMGLGLHYAEPPASFEQRGQKVRRPAVQLNDGVATCLDTTVLFAAALEAAGLHPVIMLFKGHAAIGVWLTKRSMANTVEPDPMELRRAIGVNELLVFETTAVTHRPPLSMAQATLLLAGRLEESQDGNFIAAIDVHRARSGGITPLASHDASRDPLDAADNASIELSLPAAPGAGDLPADWVEIKPTTATGRIDRWQRKLLDLTLRNRLLNFADSRKTIPFLCPDVSDLEDRLADGAAIHLISLPEQNPLGDRDAQLYKDVRGRDLDRDFAAEAVTRNELPSPLTAKELEARLIDLYRQVRNDLAESGTNSLFLAVGFLRWKKKPDDARAYRAPLLLVPVKLERRSASSRFTLGFHEDEPRFNATLLQFLERDFDLKLPQFAGELPQDHSGVDVPRVLGLMRQAIRDVPGMEVVDETALSTFSFAKYLMWKDLTDRTDALRRNRVVRHLIDSPEKAFGGDGTFRDERALDLCAPADIISLLPADSSQIAASMAAAEGRDFVIIGPPGTGKSQTIANMIANCLGTGKTVLFVAEKTAALNVVYRRLREHGLGDHCLELHSNKADRKHFLNQLKKSWESSGGQAAGWIELNEKLRVRRDELNAYVAALHRTDRNGLTPYAAMGVSLRATGRHAPALSWPDRNAHDDAERKALAELSADLGRIYAATLRKPALHSLDVEAWSAAWQETLVGRIGALRDAAAQLTQDAVAIVGVLGLPRQADMDLATLEKLNVFACALRDQSGNDLGIMFDRYFDNLRPALTELGTAIDNHGKAFAGLSVAYSRDAVASIPVEALEKAWRDGKSALWPISWIKQAQLRKRLGTYAQGAQPKPDTDLPLLRRLQALQAVVEASPLADKPVAFAGLDTSVAAVDRHLAEAERMRDCVRRLGRLGQEGRAVVAAIRPALEGDRMHPLFSLADAYARSHAAFTASLRQFRQAAGQERETDVTLNVIIHQMDELMEARPLLRDWTAWCATRNRARNRGLGPLITDLEAGRIAAEDTEAAFHLAYARWWLPQAIDADPVLREFRRFQHEHAITEFRQIDDLVRLEAAARVISALPSDLPSVQGVPRNSELGLLRHQMELQRPSRAIREMIAALPTAFPKLAPCMLMSPLSIAQYLPPDQALFDVVIFDEASQITTWDAVGAIARGRQTIIVGDPKQLPPTNFFGRNEDGDDEQIADHERDLESILDEAKASGIPVRDLRWHYRSRNESLIAFSNHHYYQNRLITFPSPSVEDRAVQLRPVKEGVYDRGKSRTNAIEARAVTDAAVSRMRQWLKLEEKNRPTLGVITFNAQQQSLITDLLDQARRDHPALEWFFADDRTEPTIVKNLENVQGDERDVILFSITFWKDSSGKPPAMDFGALNRDGGERRLNVAVTRARQELLVFSGFTADQIDTARTKALGVRHLKTFLDFAERGAIALPAADLGSVGGVDSPFEAAIIEALEQRGWQTIPQVGVSGFRVDIGVRHPDRPGAYLAGVECDGATYHSAATARDRDKVREQVLRGLGWTILRVWSTDWWFDAAAATDRLHDALVALLNDSRQAEITAEEPAETVPEDTADDLPDSDIVMPPARPNMVAMPVSGIVYRLSDLSDLAPAPDRFHEADYRHTLREMIERIVDAESPLRADILAQRIARAHGWLRTGGRIRERIDIHLGEVDRTQESSGEFIWKKGTIRDIVDYRTGMEDTTRRGIPDIALAELAALALDNRGILSSHDPALELSRLMGVERLTASSRARLDEALDRARECLAAPGAEL